MDDKYLKFVKKILRKFIAGPCLEMFQRKAGMGYTLKEGWHRWKKFKKALHSGLKWCI